MLGALNQVSSKLAGEIAHALIAGDKWTQLEGYCWPNLISQHQASSELLLWLARERSDSFADILGPEVFRAMLTAMERDQFNEKRSNKLRDFILDDQTLLVELIGSADLEVIKDLTRALQLSPCFDDMDKRSLLARIVKSYPAVQSMISGEQSKEKQEANFVVSWESLERRKNEYAELVQKSIPANSKEIAIARSYGDLRENHEYKAAKEMQKILMRRKSELEAQLVRARGGDFANPRTDVVSIGTRVAVTDLGQNVRRRTSPFSGRGTPIRTRASSAISPPWARRFSTPNRARKWKCRWRRATNAIAWRRSCPTKRLKSMHRLARILGLCGLAVNALAADVFVAPHGGFTDETAAPRQYAPDRNAGFVHMSLDITPDFQQRTITGAVTFTFKPIAKPLAELELNAAEMNIVAVESPAKIQAWQLNADQLVVTFASPIPADQESSVTIRYTAQPEKGLYFRTPELGYKPGDEHLFTQGESTDNRYWFPGPDAPNEKFTTEVTCHVPQGMTVLSNGRLVSQGTDAAGLATFHWSQEKPHANYLVSLVAGYFKSVEDKHNDTPLALYVPPSEIGEAANSFADTRDIMDFYEHDIGVPFPWAKYYQVMVQDFMEGGMENTTLTTLTENTLFTSATENLRNSQGLVAHEMAHQWFGDLVTCKDWSHIWLNEGFATFYALLYHGHKNGNDDMLYALYATARQIYTISNDVTPIVSRKFDSPDSIFSWLPYQKGGYVLRMLRAQLGDELYRRCIRSYLERHQYGSVVTDDLAAVIEEISGRSYDQFFDQWLYHAHHPELAAAYSWDEKTKLAKLSLQQKQTLSEEVLLFNFPLTVAFQGKSGKVEKTITVKQKVGGFLFRPAGGARHRAAGPAPGTPREN